MPRSIGRSHRKSMGEYSTLMARDGHEFQAWLAAPAGRARGAGGVIPGIFGLHSPIRAGTDRFPAGGYTALAPPPLHRGRRRLALGHRPQDPQEGTRDRPQLTP